MGFILPFPNRPPVADPPLAMLRAARRNLLEIWPEPTFHEPYFGHSLLRRSIFVCNSPETVRDVFVDDAANVMQKSPQHVHALKPLIGDGLFISDGALWHRRRRAVAPLTHVSRMDEFLPSMVAAAKERSDIWLARGGAETDVLAEMAEMTADVICRAVIGTRPWHAKAQEVVRGFSAYQAEVGQMDLPSLLGLPDFLPRLASWPVRRNARCIQGVVDAMLGSALDGKGAVESSMVRSLADALGADEPDVPRALRNEASVPLMAGHETTANTLAWAWYMLSQDAESWDRLCSEVDGLPAAPASQEDVARLPFSRAVLDETLRLFPPVTIQARRLGKTRQIAGQTVAAGTIIMIVPWLPYRHRRYWDQPDTFVPARFLPDGSGAPSRYAYVPFSVGPRICTGTAFALTEMVICLATLARGFRPVLRPGHKVMPVCRLSLRPGEGLPMRLVPRHGSG